MKNILVISQSFAPRNVIASVRFTKVVKYLSRTGKYHFWVVCIGSSKDMIRDELLQRDIEEVAEYVTVLPVQTDKKLVKRFKSIFSVRKANPAIRKANASGEKKDLYYLIQNSFVMCKQEGIAGRAKRMMGRLMLAANDVYDLVYEIQFAYKGAKLLRQIPINNMDVMISTYPQVGSLLLALKFKKCKRDLKWIADYRDAIMAASGIKKRYLKYVTEKADKNANYITGATDSCFGSGKYKEKFYVITNGFDREDIKGFKKYSKNEKLEIVYTGSLYGGKRDMTILFKIISELEAEGALSSEKISVLYAGPQFHILVDQAKVCNMTKLLVNKGQLSRKKALELQYRADIVCVLSLSEEGYENWLPAKTLECLMMESPVFSIVTGFKTGSIVKKITQSVGLGYCYEEAGGFSEYVEAKKWFLEKYLEFIENGQVVFEPNEKEIEKYSSENMAKRFGMLIEKC